MEDRTEMYKWPEYWLERIQNDIFRMVRQYMEQEGLNQSGLSKHLGVSKGYISQILNGNFNFSLSKLIELCLTLGVSPCFDFKTMEEYIEKEEVRLERMQNGFISVSINPTSTSFNLDSLPDKDQIFAA
jgi:transcriptional regulator with XRE-family HTH domain